LCENSGGEGVDVFTSWEGHAASQDSRHAAGIDVYIRERGATQFRLVPKTEAAWSAVGIPGEGMDSFRVGARGSLELMLDLRRLTALGADAEAVRLEFHSDSQSLDPYESSLSGSYLSPRTEVPSPQSPSPVRVVRPPAPSITPVTTPPAPAPQAPAPAAAVYVSFVGTMGEKAVLKVSHAEGVEGEKMVAAVGDLVDPDWSLAKIERAPSAVTLTSTTKDQTRVVRRGETVDLNSGLSAPTLSGWRYPRARPGWQR
jgi:hypothetical protein